MHRLRLLQNLTLAALLLLFILILPVTFPAKPVLYSGKGEEGYYRKVVEWNDKSVLPPKELQTLLPRIIDTPPFHLMRKKIDHGPGVNLSLGKPYTVTIQWEDPLFHRLENHYPDAGKRELTDGIYGSLDWKNGSNPWTAFLRQEGRWITLDLTEVKMIQSISLDFLQRLDGGITVPEYVRYELSTDGKNWALAGEVKATVPHWESKPDSDPFLLKGVKKNARYVRAYFPASVFHFADEFTVYGQAPTKENPTKKTVVEEKSIIEKGYLKPDHLPEKIHHLFLHYVRQREMRKTDFQPVVTYIDPKGKISDWMYDAILFVPVGLTPTKKSWEAWLDTIFFAEEQMNNLNTAVAFGKIYMLGKDVEAYRHKVKVLITIPYPSIRTSSWEDGDSPVGFNPLEVGQKESYRNRLLAVKWFIDQALERWRRAGFSNLELVGFYWDGETLNQAAQYEENLIKDTANYLHERGLQFYWIPYYGAYGAEKWKELGFDAAMVQPNYSFSDVDVRRLENVAAWARRYGTGIEIEAHWFTTARDKIVASHYKNRYYDYLTAGHLLKYEYATVNAWYMNLSTLQDAYASHDPFYREIYDHTYRYLKEMWSETEYRSIEQEWGIGVGK